MPGLSLHKAYPLVRTSSAFQIFLLERLREENPVDEGLGQGLDALGDPELEDKIFEVENWLSSNEAECTSIVEEVHYRQAKMSCKH